MLTSIVVTGTHKIETTKAGKFEVNGETLITRDTPFVRYRFQSYSDNEFRYIKGMQKQFEHSAHLAEVQLDAQSCSTTLSILNNLTNICIYLYIPIEEEGITQRSLEDLADLLSGLEQKGKRATEVFDRIMIKDNTTSLTIEKLNGLINLISQTTACSKDKIGVCSSPLSFNGMACLTAVKARELAALHCTSGDLALPTGKHECMESCGCIRHIMVTSDILQKSEVIPKQKDKDTSKTSKAPKKPKGGIPMW